MISEIIKLLIILVLPINVKFLSSQIVHKF